MCKVKICGLTRIEDIWSVNQSRPDYIGFVFAPSKRRVTKEQAKYLKSFLRPDILVVGVFVNEGFKEIIALVKEKIIDIVQLHGDEDEHYIERLKSMIPGTPLIKAIAVGEEWNGISLDVDYYLLDKKSKGVYGGTGQSFDWGKIGKLDKPFFLAGGLDEYNMERAMRTNAYCMDVSSGVESQGKKDKIKIHRIIQKVRGYCG